MSIYFLENAPTKTEKPAIFLKIRENDDLESKTQKLEIVIWFFLILTDEVKKLNIFFCYNV